MMKKMVKIIASIDSKEGKEDKIEFTTEGKYQKTDGVITVLYEESEVSGMKGSLTTLKVKDDSVAMKREGIASSEMLFEVGKRYESEYSTAYGVLKVELLTKFLECKFDEKGNGIIAIEYDMSIKGLSESSNRLVVEVF